MQKGRLTGIIVLVATLAVTGAFVAGAQNSPPTGNENTAAPRPGGGLVILDFKPAMDDLMTMLIQPRHIKLYFAGRAKNWTLAAFELNELRGALARIGRTIPTYRKINVDEAVASIFADRMKAVDAAIKAADPMQFSAAYADMTQACNYCHVGLEHPFLKITVPEAVNYPDQDFGP